MHCFCVQNIQSDVLKSVVYADYFVFGVQQVLFLYSLKRKKSKRNRQCNFLGNFHSQNALVLTVPHLTLELSIRFNKITIIKFRQNV